MALYRAGIRLTVDGGTADEAERRCRLVLTAWEGLGLIGLAAEAGADGAFRLAVPRDTSAGGDARPVWVIEAQVLVLHPFELAVDAEPAEREAVLRRVLDDLNQNQAFFRPPSAGEVRVGRFDEVALTEQL